MHCKDVVSANAGRGWEVWFLPHRVQIQMAQLLLAYLPPKCAVWQDPWVPRGQDSQVCVVQKSILWTAKSPVRRPWEIRGTDAMKISNYATPKLDLGLKVLQPSAPSRLLFSLWQGPQPFAEGITDSSFHGNLGPLFGPEG